MMRGSRRNVHNQREVVVNQLEVVESRIKELVTKREQAELAPYEAYTLEKLEKEARLLSRMDRVLEQKARSCFNRLVKILRPFQVLFGIFFMVFGFMIFSSLGLSCVDKAIHSSMKSGFVLVNGTLPNPADWILVFFQHIFPLDYIMYVGMVIFLVFCTMSGVKNIGIRFLWIHLYQIRGYKTKPQGLIMLCGVLIFIIIALNVVMYSTVPDYTTYGSQRYQISVFDPLTNKTNIEIIKCADSPDVNLCVSSVISRLLTAFHEKAWIFGAMYFWLDWALIFVVVLGSLVSTYFSSVKCCSSSSMDDDDEENRLVNEENDDD